MSILERLRIAVRYTFALGGGHLSTFLSSLSMLGLILAIGLLILVLSVMNGFDKEMRERILSMVPHITLHSTIPLEAWQGVAEQAREHSEVLEVTPFTEFDALFMRGGDIETARGVGVEVNDRAIISRLLADMDATERETFLREPNSLILGSALADRLQVSPGDELTMIVPGRGGSLDASGARFEHMRLAGVLTTGTELDQAAALVPLTLASAVAGLGDAVSGLRLATSNLFDVNRIGWELVNSLPPGFYATNWMMTHGNLYSAIQLSRDLITILLLSIIAVAAFNVVSSLVLVVFDKQGDIAILRTLGASPGDIASIFIMQGAMIGLVGVVLGAILGSLGGLAAPSAVAWLERVFDVSFLNTDVYPVSFIPVDLLPKDILIVGGVALVMCVVAAIYPALRASRLAPAMVLNQDRS
ncbi:MAG: lipoprotein-releasing ABC transporter permease subunit [Pseudomonadota bacterium]